MRVCCALVLPSSACSDALDPDAYTRDCESADDCFAVTLDNLWCCGVDASVNRRERGRVDADVRAVRAGCAPHLFVTCDGLSAPMRTTCNAGVCGLEPDIPDRASMWAWTSPLAATLAPTNVRVTGSQSARDSPRALRALLAERGSRFTEQTDVTR